MAEATSIEWCDHTWSPWEGCTKVSPGCDYCYAAARNGRFAGGRNWGPGAPRRPTADWTRPGLLNRKARRDGVRRSIFPSLCDPFDLEVPIEWFIGFLEVIRRTPHLNWLLLTKRIGNARKRLNEALDACDSVALREWIALWLGGEPPDNVWLGATFVNQEEIDRDYGKLFGLAAVVHFASIEPMLGPITFRWTSAWPKNAPTCAQRPGGHTDHLDGLRRLDWVIAGGESGPQARPAHPDWFRSLRDQCATAGVPFLFKQHGEHAPGHGTAKGFVYLDQGQTVRCGDKHTHEWGDGVVSQRIGKKAAGRLLDGVEHNGFPGAQQS